MSKRSARAPTRWSPRQDDSLAYQRSVVTRDALPVLVPPSAGMRKLVHHGLHTARTRLRQFTPINLVGRLMAGAPSRIYKARHPSRGFLPLFAVAQNSLIERAERGGGGGGDHPARRGVRARKTPAGWSWRLSACRSNASNDSSRPSPSSGAAWPSKPPPFTRPPPPPRSYRPAGLSFDRTGLQPVG